MSEPVARSPRDLLDRVIDELNDLRNAGNRSPLFKLWRQNALTAIQRIWPNDAQHSERFRRIPFSAPTSRADGREVRECYERGCGEALSLLKTLRDEIGDKTFASVDATQKRHTYAPGEAEDDFPTLDLTDSGISYSTSPTDAPRRDTSNLDLPLEAEPYEMDNAVDPSISSVRDLTPRPARHAPEPPRAAEPKLRTPTDAAARPAAKATSAVSAKGKPARSAKKAAPKGRLKDMLGFTDSPEDEPAESAPPAAAAPVETPRAKPAPEPPATLEERRRPEAAALRREITALDTAIKEAKANAEPKAGGSRRWQPGATRTERIAAQPHTERTAPEPATHAERAMEEQAKAQQPAAVAPPAPAPRAPVEPAAPARSATTPTARPARRAALPPAEFLMPPESIEATEPHVFEETPRRPAPRVSDPIEPKPVLPIAAVPDDPQRTLEAADVQPQPSDGLHFNESDDSASLTAEFLRNSPVLSSAPRAVPPKTSAALETFESPTASALHAMSAMVGDLGVPEGHRARARAALLDMARQLESREMSWDHMRDAVQFLMEFPPLARRALPLLLPYLDQAA